MIGNPDLAGGNTLSNFLIWNLAAIHLNLYRLNLRCKQKNIQVRHSVHTKLGTLIPTEDFNLLAKVLLAIGSHFVSKFYSKLKLLNIDRLLLLWTLWENQSKTNKIMKCFELS